MAGNRPITSPLSLSPLIQAMAAKQKRILGPHLTNPITGVATRHFQEYHHFRLGRFCAIILVSIVGLICPLLFRLNQQSFHNDTHILRKRKRKDQKVMMQHHTCILLTFNGTNQQITPATRQMILIGSSNQLRR